VTAVPPVLSGLTVIAVEQYGAGPYGSMQLADLGATVWKIENPAEGGDMARRVGPYFHGPNDSQFFHSFNRNKKSVTLDLKRPGARRVLHALAARADALFDNLRGDLPGKLGLTYADLAPANPRIVCAHLSAYGRDGSRAHFPGYDYLMQAETGYLSLTGEPDGPPARMGLSIVDLMTGLFAAFALVSGVLAARQSGRGPTSTSACSTPRCRTSPISRPGTSIPATSRAASRARPIRRWCRASSAAPATASSS
jgi:crotonobetainyl-CoA:carnitine CoA-transferase CaiB-like acyl-CoA transferase